MQSVTELSMMQGPVYVHLKDRETAEQFLKQAEAEGFAFGDGGKPTSRSGSRLYAIHPGRIISHVGAVGHMAYQANAVTKVEWARG